MSLNEATEAIMLNDFREFQQRRDAVCNVERDKAEYHRKLAENQSRIDAPQAWSEYNGKPAAMYRGQSVDYPAATQARPIPTTINTIDANLIALNQSLLLLADRLDPILGPVPPGDLKAPGGGFSMGSPDRVLDRLSEFVWRTQAAIDQVTELANRVEV